jgi:small-conductance mechanosensitive channel
MIERLKVLKQLLPDNLMIHALIAVAIIIAAYLLSGVVKRLLTWVGKKFFAKTQTALDDLILEVVRKNVRVLMLILGVKIATREIRKGLYPEHLTIEQMLEYVDAIVFVAAVYIVVRVVFGIVRILVTWYLDELEEGGDSQLKMTLAPLASKILALLIGMVGAIVILDHFGINIGSLLVSLGVGSLAVALAAQDTLANMIAGFVIMVDRPFRVGDRIELPTGQIGDVHRIGLRSTQILNFDANVIIVPNAELVKSRIVNFAFPFNQMRVLVKFGVAYGVRPESVRSLLLEIVRAHPDIVGDPPPQVFFTAMNDSALEFTLVARAADYQKRFTVECALREQAYLAFQQAGIEIPFPQRVVHMKSAS